MITEPTSESHPESPEAEQRNRFSGSSARGLFSRNWPVMVVVALTCLPALRMVLWIVSGTHVQFSDYWMFLSELIRPDGSVRWAAMAEFQAQHLLSVPLLIYLINIWLFGGSNITLGLIVVAVVAAQLAVLWRWIRKLESVPFALRGALLVFASALLFSPYGAWNFIRAMSGTAWLTANLISILAIHLAARERTYFAVSAALLATITYGTGVMVWPALVVVVVLRRRPLVEVGVTVVAGAVVAGTYVTVRSSQVWTDTVSSFDIWDTLVLMAMINGRLIGLHVDLVRAAGFAALLATAILVPIAIIRCRDKAVPFIGLIVFALLAGGQVAYGRAGIDFGSDGINTSRYTSLGALTWIGLACLAVAVVGSIERARVRRWGSLSLLVAFTMTAISAPFRGHSEARNSLGESARVERLADAQRLKVSRGYSWFFFVRQPDIDDRLEKIGHYPFDGRWNTDCGWLDRTFDQPVAPAEGEVGYHVRSALPDGIRIVGWMDGGDADLDCLLLLDDAYTVVGVARTYPDAAVVRGIEVAGYAPLTSEPTKLVAYVPDADRWVELDIRGGGD